MGPAGATRHQHSRQTVSGGSGAEGEHGGARGEEGPAEGGSGASASASSSLSVAGRQQAAAVSGAAGYQYCVHLPMSGPH